MPPTLCRNQASKFPSFVACTSAASVGSRSAQQPGFYFQTLSLQNIGPPEYQFTSIYQSCPYVAGWGGGCTAQEQELVASKRTYAPHSTAVGVVKATRNSRSIQFCVVYILGSVKITQKVLDVKHPRSCKYLRSAVLWLEGSRDSRGMFLPPIPLKILSNPKSLGIPHQIVRKYFMAPLWGSSKRTSMVWFPCSNLADVS